MLTNVSACAVVVNILEVPEGREVAVVATVYKEMRLKPSILDEYSKDKGVKAALGTASFCSEDDTVVLEDEGARMAVSGAGLPVALLVTGALEGWGGRGGCWWSGWWWGWGGAEGRGM